MNRSLRRLLIGAVAATLFASVLGPVAMAQDDTYKVLVVGKTSGFRHGSIVPATTAIMALGAAHGFTVDVWDPQVTGTPGYNSAGQPTRTLPSTPFTSAENLAQYETLIFVSTVDNTNNMSPTRIPLLPDGELEALQGYIRNGGGFAGVHAATDSMHTRPWYGQLTGGGARFRNHPANQFADKVVEDPNHVSTEFLPERWRRFDEWYNFFTSPRPWVRVLLNLDETSYSGSGPGSGAMGADHPIAWCHNFEGGRSWYTAGGHTNESFTSDPLFLQHLLAGIEWSAGVTDGDSDCVTFREMDSILEELDEGDRTEQDAAARLAPILDGAETSADSGNHAAAIRQLQSAAALASSIIHDSDTGAHVAGKIDDLATWQQAKLESAFGGDAAAASAASAALRAAINGLDHSEARTALGRSLDRVDRELAAWSHDGSCAATATLVADIARLANQRTNPLPAGDAATLTALAGDLTAALACSP